MSFTGNGVTPPTNLIPRIRQTNMLGGAGDFISDFGGEGSFGESADIFGDSGGGTFDTDKPADGSGNIHRKNDTDAGAQLYTPFLSMTHGSMRYKTGGQISTRSTHLVAGFSRKFEDEKRKINNDKKSVAFSLVFNGIDHTLKDEDVMVIFNNIIKEVKNKYKAVLRDN